MNTTTPKIIFGMATMPPRIESLKPTVQSILPQCDELHIYLNDFDSVPPFLIHPKIKTYLSTEHLGDLGDVGKFYTVAQHRNCYYFTVDDKFNYAPGYAQGHIAAIEKHGRNIVVSLHGRIFHNRPCKSYYNDCQNFYGCLMDRPADVWVHEVGTGVMAFYNHPNMPGLEIYRRKNMTDIFFSIWCQENNMPLLVRKHPKKEVQIILNHDDRYSIHAMANQNDQIHTQTINNAVWRIMVP